MVVIMIHQFAVSNELKGKIKNLILTITIKSVQLFVKEKLLFYILLFCFFNIRLSDCINALENVGHKSGSGVKIQSP